MNINSFHSVSKTIETTLTGRGAWFEKFEHEPVRTSEEAAEVRPDFTIDQGAKAIILRVKSKGSKKFVMLVLPGSKQFDKNKVKVLLNSNDIRFATPEEVSELTGGVLPGGVPPWGQLFNLEVYADSRIFAMEKIIFNAGDRRVSIAMKSSDYREIVRPVIADITV